MKSIFAIVIALAILTGCDSEETSLTKARSKFQTHLKHQPTAKDPAETPPKGDLRLIKYDSAVGPLAAYVSEVPKGMEGQRLPAIIWIFGGFDNSIGETAWLPAPKEDDQSARVYRQNGIITMYPSFRGGNDNGGINESFYGEVDDVIAAHAALSKVSFVDPKRIYLGGHSTGGTLAMLVAAASENRFRAVFAFGPVAEINQYGEDELTIRNWDKTEWKLRSPIHWMNNIQAPTFVIEGADEGNAEAVRQLEAAKHPPHVQFRIVPGADHFSVLSPMNRLIASKILQDTGEKCAITLDQRELNAAVGR